MKTADNPDRFISSQTCSTGIRLRDAEPGHGWRKRRVESWGIPLRSVLFLNYRTIVAKGMSIPQQSAIR